MYGKILRSSTAIILTSFLVNRYNDSSFVFNFNNIYEFYNSHQITQVRTYRYRVKLGDTLGGIANRFDLSVNQLLIYNPQLRSRPNLIYVGEVINLTEVKPPSRKERTYTVLLGDTLDTIAIRHGLSLRAILDYNPHLASRSNRINVGEKINVGSAQIIGKNISNKTIVSNRRTIAFENLPTTRKTGSNNIGSKRGPNESCTKARENIMAIAPANGLGFTFDDYPYFFWYFPGLESDSVPVIFTLLGKETREVSGQPRTRTVTVYEKKLNLDQPGIIAFPLPSESEPLQEEEEYIWRIDIQCTPVTNMLLKYSIKRQSTDNPELISQLETAPVDQHPVIFAENGVWFDALKLIILQLRQTPGSPLLEQRWRQVLEEIQLNTLIGKPIIYIESDRIRSVLLEQVN